MRKFIFLLLSSIVVLSACNNQPKAPKEEVVERKEDSHSKDKSEEISKEETEDESSDSNEESDDNEETAAEKEEDKEDEPLIKKNELTIEQIIAMTLFDQVKVGGSDPYFDEFYVSPTGEEFYNKEFLHSAVPGTPEPYMEEVHKIEVVYYFDDILMGTEPYKMDFYQILPSGTNAQSIIGIGEEKVFFFLTQAKMDYDEMKKTGAEYSIEKMYENHKNDPRILELVDMMVKYDCSEYYPDSDC